MKKSRRTELAFLMDLKPTENRSHKLKRRLRSTVTYLKSGYTIRQIAKILKVTPFTVNKYKMELKSAFKKGFKDLESYLDAGRPCAYGNKVLA